MKLHEQERLARPVPRSLAQISHMFQVQISRDADISYGMLNSTGDGITQSLAWHGETRAQGFKEAAGTKGRSSLIIRTVKSYCVKAICFQTKRELRIGRGPDNDIVIGATLPYPLDLVFEGGEKRVKA